MSGQPKQIRRAMLFRCCGMLLLTLYLVLPFGSQITRILHFTTHFVAAPDVHRHTHDHPHSEAGHARHHVPVDALIAATTDDHAHPLLDFLNAFADFATGSEDTQITVKSVDKHLGSAPFHIKACFLVPLPTQFLSPDTRTLSGHAYVVPIPPDAIPTAV